MALLLGLFTLLVLLLLHDRSFAQSTFGAATLLFVWAARAGLVGFIAYVAAWVFMFPVMAALCGIAGVARTWLEARFVREAKRQATLRSASL